MGKVFAGVCFVLVIFGLSLTAGLYLAPRVEALLQGTVDRIDHAIGYRQ